MSPRPIDPAIHSGGADEPDGVPGADPERFREALARWASGVTIMAVRDPDDGQVHALTASSFASISARPPRVVVSLGPGAQPLPFLEPGSRFAVNILSAEQSGLASRYTDSFPVGPSPFAEEGDPVIRGAHAVLHCRAESLVPVGACRLVVGLVLDAETDDAAGPLLHYQREFRTLE